MAPWAQVTDDFSDGDLSADPAWIGDISDYEVNAGLQLQLNAAPVDNESHLSTLSQAINDASWEVDVSMDFNPSSTSSTFIYLCADQSDLEGDLNGYYVLIGDSPDEISLYRQDGNAHTLILDGTDDVVDMSAVDLRLRVTRDDAGNWELLHDVGHTGSFTSEGTVFDDSHLSSTYFGIVSKYIGSRSDAFTFDNIQVNGTGIVDLSPPELNSVEVLDGTTLELTFNEPLEQSSAENISNYTWLPFNTPTSATLIGNVVELEFPTDFPDNTPQEIQVESVEDLAGNPMTSTTLTFTHVVLGEGQFRSVIFNELMPDPSPSQGLVEAEYIELYNRSDSAFDLMGWNLRNNDNDEFLDSFILLPGAYIIICDDSDETEFSAYGDILAVSTLTALTNGGDSLYLFNAQGELMEELFYLDDWYGGEPFDDGGYSLERRNPNLPCDNPTNWGASTASIGGTPGGQNSIYVSDDTTAPELSGIDVIDESTLLLHFNEGMDELSLMIGNYTLDVSNTVIPEISTSIDQVILNISPALAPGAYYELNVSDVIDCSGNAILSSSIQFLIPDDADPEDVIINEVMADPEPNVDLPAVEYVEIHNASDKLLSLKNWTFRNTSTDMVLPDSILVPGGFFILCEKDDLPLLSSYGPVIGITSFTALSNGGDDLYLFDQSAELIDQVIYSSSWYQDSNRDEGGYSLERINPELPCSDMTNWRASEAEAGGTPGQVNSILDLSPDELAPEINSVILLQADQIQVSFSEAIELASAEDGDISLTPSIDIQNLGQNSASEIIIVLEEDLMIGQIYTLTIAGVEDCSGNEMESNYSIQLAQAQEAEQGDLIINEILFNPRTMGSDFVEIYNRSARAISLRNWKMASRIGGQLDDFERITSENIILLPQEFLVLTEEKENIILNYPLSNATRILEVPDLPGYDDDEDYVVLAEPDFSAHDEFFYSKDYHFALLDDLNGVSLERIDYERLTNDPTNWHSAAEKAGWATPGYENSQLQPANLSSESFSLSPDVFSPDNDGFQDVLNISYAQDQAGSVANISIFDRDGRLIRLLTRNQLLATSGTISWDGIRDDGAKARIGVYIVFIELFDLKGNVSSTKKTCVLGGSF